MKKLLALLAVVLASSPAAMAGVETDGVKRDTYISAYTLSGSAVVYGNLLNYTYNPYEYPDSSYLCVQTANDSGCIYSTKTYTVDSVSGTSELEAEIMGSQGLFEVNLKISAEGVPYLGRFQNWEVYPASASANISEGVALTRSATVTGTVTYNGELVANFESEPHSGAIGNGIHASVQVTP